MKEFGCTYCLSGLGTKRDHVPPRGFFEFPIPRNAQLITVPCSEDCRQKDAANDEVVRNVLTSLIDTEVIDYVAKHILPRRDRSLERSQACIKNMMELMQSVKIKNNEGQTVGEDLAFTLAHPSLGGQSHYSVEFEISTTYLTSFFLFFISA